MEHFERYKFNSIPLLFKNDFDRSSISKDLAFFRKGERIELRWNRCLNDDDDDNNDDGDVICYCIFFIFKIKMLNLEIWLYHIAANSDASICDWFIQWHRTRFQCVVYTHFVPQLNVSSPHTQRVRWIIYSFAGAAAQSMTRRKYFLVVFLIWHSRSAAKTFE